MMSKSLDEYIMNMAKENRANQLSDLKKALELMMGSEMLELKHFHPERRPENLKEAFDIYERHGRENWTQEAQDIYEIKPASDLLHGKRFIAVDYSGFYDGDLYFIYEFDEDFETADRLYGFYYSLEEALEAEEKMEV